MVSRVLCGRAVLALAVLLLPYIGYLKFHPKSDPGLSGWSSPAPLTFETAKPRNTAQSSGTFFSIVPLSVYSLPGLVIVFPSCFYFIQNRLEFFSLSQLQRWQL
jgi:hypothetical protein